MSLMRPVSLLPSFAIALPAQPHLSPSHRHPASSHLSLSSLLFFAAWPHVPQGWALVGTGKVRPALGNGEGGSEDRDKEEFALQLCCCEGGKGKQTRTQAASATYTYTHSQVGASGYVPLPHVYRYKLRSTDAAVTRREFFMHA